MMRRVCVGFALAALAAPLCGAAPETQAPRPITDPANADLNARPEFPYLDPADCDKFHGKLPRLYLHGLWKLKIAPNPGTQPGPGEYVFDDAGMREGWTRGDCDDAGWQDFYVPQKIRPGTNNVIGVKLKTFELSEGRVQTADGYAYQAVRFAVPPEQRGKRVILYLAAANNLPVVYINGVEVARPRNYALAEHADRQWIDITEHVRPDGVNRLVVRTYGIFTVDQWPVTGYHWNCNGVWQPVWLEFWPEVRTTLLRIKPRWPDSVDVSLTFENAGAAGRRPLRVTVEPWRGKYSTAVDERAKPWTLELAPRELAKGPTQLSFSMRLSGIEPWHMEHPYLYGMKVLVDGQLAGWDTFGMRSLGRDGRRLLVNGQSAYFFGVGWSDASILNSLGGAAQDTFRQNKNGFLARLLEFYRNEAGMNAVVRNELGFLTDVVYQLCDEIGLARWDERCPVPRNGGAALKTVGNRFYGRCRPDDEAWLAYYRRYVDLNFNHPSIFAWGMESELHHDAKSGIEAEVRLARSVDDGTRWVFLEGIHFAHCEAVPGKGKRWTWWRRDEGIPGVDFVQTHNLPMQYETDKPFGRGIEELRAYEERSRTAYAAQGGLPMIASPALFLEEEAFRKGKEVFDGAAFNRKALVEFQEQERDRKHWTIAPFNRMVIGIGPYISMSPRKHLYIGFEQQRLGETMRLNSAFFRGFGTGCYPLFQPTSWSVQRGETLDPAHIRAGAVAAYMKRLTQRVLPVLDWHLKHHAFAGDTVPYTLNVLNDAIAPFPGGAVAIRLVPGDAFDNFGKTQELKEVNRLSCPVSSVAVGERFEKAVELAVPTGLAAGRYTLELVLEAGGREVARNGYPFRVGRRESARIRAAVKTALYEPAVTNAAPGVGPILTRLGVPFTRLADFAALAGHGLLVIGPRALDEKLREQGDRIHDWLLAGGRVLCLEQDTSGACPFLTQARFVKTRWHVAEPIVPQHPAFAGLEDIRDWDNLNGDSGLLFRAAVEPLSESVLLAAAIPGGDFIARASPGKCRDCRFGMALCENREGKGLCWLSQVEAVARYETDPVARRYLEQLLAYALSPEAGQHAAPILGVYKPLNSHATLATNDVFFVDLARHCNRAFRDQTAGDGEGGWDDGGPTNDMRISPGTPSLEGVPFRILEPTRNGGRACIVLGGGRLSFVEEVKGIPVGQTARALHFLHAHGYGGDKDAFALYTVRYADGTALDIPLVSGRNTGSWWGAAEVPGATVAWTGENEAAGTICLYRMRWPNPHPQKPIAALDFVSRRTGNTVPILVAVTGEK